MRTVLASLGQLHIRGEYEGPGSEGGIDDVILDLGSESVDPTTQDLVSTFDDPDHGWLVVGNGSLGISTPSYSEDGGRPGGHASIEDASNSWTWYWTAPEEFLGDLSPAYGGALTFDLSASPGVYARGGHDVILRGTQLTLWIDTAYNPESGWTSYTVQLHDLAGWRRGGTDELATEAELRAVLSSLRQMWIRGEFRGPGSVGGLDNVVVHLP